MCIRDRAMSPPRTTPDVEQTHDLLAKAWLPILNCFQGDEQRWGRFLEYYGEDIPRAQAPDLPELSGHTLWQALQRR
eukprot:15024420-Alexandrium_andersonii.AAC.1